MLDSLPYSQPSENNKDFILEILARHLPDPARVLEIGGGTGQHAVHFATQLPHLNWQSSDLPDNVDSLNQRILLASLENLAPAISLDIRETNWPGDMVNTVFTANTLHIMAESSVRLFFTGAGKKLFESGLLMVYGPFKYQGEFTTESNAGFDLWLKARDPLSGIRDFEMVQDCAIDAGLEFIEDNAMPANNQLLVWRKTV